MIALTTSQLVGDNREFEIWDILWVVSSLAANWDLDNVQYNLVLVIWPVLAIIIVHTYRFDKKK